jgi:nitrate reductase delta subunit
VVPPYKIISLLLQYPNQRLLQERAEIDAAVARLPQSEQRAAIECFLGHWQHEGTMALEEQYAAMFDSRGRVNLHLTYYLYEDRRRRGMAQLQLKKEYAAGGLRLISGELPDFLPVMLEFAAFAPTDLAGAVLREFRVPIEAERLALHDAGSPYAHLLDALHLSLPGLTAEQGAVARRLSREGPYAEQLEFKRAIATPRSIPEGSVD